MGRTQLQESGHVTLDANGDGTVILGPNIVRERWAPTQASVSASTNVREARCALYVGIGGVPGNLLQETRTGSTGDVYGFGGFEMQSGQNIVAIWRGGDAGATATLNVYGEKVRGD